MPTILADSLTYFTTLVGLIVDTPLIYLLGLAIVLTIFNNIYVWFFDFPFLNRKGGE